MAHPLDHRQLATGGPRLHVYAGRNEPVSGILCAAMAMMLRSMILDCVARPSTPCQQSSYTTSILSLVL